MAGPLEVAMLVQDSMLVMAEGRLRSPTLAAQQFPVLNRGAMSVCVDSIYITLLDLEFELHVSEVCFGHNIWLYSILV